MAKLSGQQKGSSDFEKHIFDDGIYDMKLVKVMGMLGKPNQFHPDGQPKMLMIWAWCDENGNEYQMDDGQPYELVDALGMPKNFAYNEKSNYWKRLSGISGTVINNDNVANVDHDFGEFITSFQDILEVIENADPDKPDRKGKVFATSIEVAGVEQLGRVCKLVVKKKPSENDPTKFFNNIESVLQAEASQPKRPPVRAAAQQAPQAQSKPPARPATPAPAPTTAEKADLPF